MGDSQLNQGLGKSALDRVTDKPMALTLEDFLANNIQHMFDRPTMYGPATNIESAFRLHLHFASLVCDFEPLLARAAADVASRIGYDFGQLAEGYYRDNPDVADCAVRDFVLAHYRSLVGALSIPLPSRVIELVELPAPIATSGRGGAWLARTPDVVRIVESVRVWVVGSVKQLVDSPESSRSAYHLEDELTGFFWVWGIVFGKASDVHKRTRKIRDEHHADMTIASQFFYERPWATAEEAMKFVLDGYSEMSSEILRGQT